MKIIFQKLKKFSQWMHELKFDRKALIVLIILDLLMAFGSNIVDWPWLLTVAKNSWYLTPFAPICSLYPLTLAIWFLIYYKKKSGSLEQTEGIKMPIKMPDWLTTFIFIGISSYGVMSLIYFPLYMSWYGFELQTVGNMFWVTIYAIQSLIIASELKPVPLYQYTIIIIYFAFKDFADRFLGTFIDTLDPDYPNYMLQISTVSILTLHIIFIILAIKISYQNQTKIRNHLLMEPAD